MTNTRKCMDWRMPARRHRNLHRLADLVQHLIPGDVRQGQVQNTAEFDLFLTQDPIMAGIRNWELGT